MSQLRAPVLLHASNQHERLYIAAFDGTGNSMYKDDPANHTNVAEIVKQIDKNKPPNIGYGYVEGPGTQDGYFTSTRDKITGGTFEARLEEMYKKFAEQSAVWLKQDPQAKIRLAGIGFSRGAEQEAGFARLVHERGIQNPEGAVYTRDRGGNITHVEYAKPPLVPPGTVIQAVGLFDPVATGEPEKHDRRLPPSVLSGFQITAEDERRDQFKSTDMLRPGFSEDNRFLNVTVGGAHSNIGGSYALNGLSIRTGNLMIDYINGLSDRPFLDKRPEPSGPALNVVHRSEDHQFFYTTKGFRDGERERSRNLADPELCRTEVLRDCWNKEPHDRALDRGLERRGVPIAPTPVDNRRSSLDPEAPDIERSRTAATRSTPRSEIDALYDRLALAAINKDDAAMNAVSRDYLRSPAGQQWQHEVTDYRQQMEAQERQAAQEALLAQQAQEAQVYRGPVMRI